MGNKSCLYTDVQGECRGSFQAVNIDYLPVSYLNPCSADPSSLTQISKFNLNFVRFSGSLKKKKGK